MEDTRSYIMMQKSLQLWAACKKGYRANTHNLRELTIFVGRDLTPTAISVARKMPPYFWFFLHEGCVDNYI